MVIMKYSMIMASPSWKIAWSCHGDYGHYYNIIRTLIIQPTLLISKQVASPLFFNKEHVVRTHQKLPERRLINGSLCQNVVITENNKKAVICMLYWNCCLIRTCCQVNTEENSKSTWSNLRLILLTRNCGGVNSCKGSQVFLIMVYGRNLWENFDKRSITFLKTNMDNMMTIPWSWHESWKTW